MPERRIVAKLLATNAVTALIGTRVRPVKLRQQDALPALVYRRTSSTPVNHSRGTDATEQATIEIDCIAASYGGAKALAAAVKAAISGWSDETGTPSVSMCHLSPETDNEVDIDAGADEGIYGVQQTYLLWYS